MIVLAIPGELLFAVWLLFKGVNTEAWMRKAKQVQP